jgi:hypothetical protein
MTPSFTKEKIFELLDLREQQDPARRVFGADTHQYRLHPPLSVFTIRAFESKCGTVLPADYRYFITEVGNGGAGPYYGLFPFGEHDAGDGLCSWDEGGLLGDLSAAFPHDSAWNLPDSFWDRMPDPGPEVSLEEEDRLMQAWVEQLDTNYWNPSIMNGAIPICHIGCALRLWLVINGRQKGIVWYDRRADHAGISPLRNERNEPMTFSDWYMAWLVNPKRAMNLP